MGAHGLQKAGGKACRTGESCLLQLNWCKSQSAASSADLRICNLSLWEAQIQASKNKSKKFAYTLLPTHNSLFVLGIEHLFPWGQDKREKQPEKDSL